MKYRADDISLLLPSFAAKVHLVLADMRALGHEPCPFDTLRTPAEAAKFHARGVGSKDSMHIYGVACDVICDRHGWSCTKHKCLFFRELGRAVEAQGLVWGGRWRRRDLPHFQGCTVADQNKVRAMTWDEREAYISAGLCQGS